MRSRLLSVDSCEWVDEDGFIVFCVKNQEGIRETF